MGREPTYTMYTITSSGDIMSCNMVILDLIMWISTLNTPITGQVWRQIVASNTSCWSGEEGLHPIRGYHTWLVWSPGWVDMAAPYTTIRSRAPHRPRTP